MARPNLTVYSDDYGRNRGRTRIKMVGGELVVSDGTSAMSKSFADIPRRTGHLEAAFAAFIPIWHQQERAVFRAQGLPERWPPLSKDYESWKRANYPGQTILRRDDLLYRSLTTRARYSVIDVRPRSLRLGTSLWYSEVLTEGTGRVPKPRPHVVILRETFEMLNALCLAEILAAPELKGGRRR